MPAAAGAARWHVCPLPERGGGEGPGWPGLGLAVCWRLPPQTVSGGGLCCLDTDQMTLGADEPLAGAAGASSAFPSAAGSVGEGLTFSWRCAGLGRLEPPPVPLLDPSYGLAPSPA